jgi:hypothetical protein
MHYLRLYADCVRRAAQAVRKSPWTLLLPMFYWALGELAQRLLGPLGMVGGFLLVIVSQLMASSFLYFVGQSVVGSPSRVAELKQSFLAYFWPVVSFGFVTWMATMGLSLVLAGNPQGEKIQLGIVLVAAVLLNAVPEVIYQKAEVNGLGIVMESVRFIQRHWIEWFIPNLVLAAAFYFTLMGVARLPYSLLLAPPLLGAIVYVAATVRGNLFHVLDTTSPYQLRMRYGRRG